MKQFRARFYFKHINVIKYKTDKKSSDKTIIIIIIIIAHRLSTVINADEIVVLQKGDFLEQGSHKEL